jgi:metallophosphoesterase (TIGR03767 family)
MASRKSIRSLVATGVVVAIGIVPLTGASTTAATTGTARYTTLKRTIVGKAERDLEYGPGAPRYVRDLRWGHTGGKGRALVGFKHISDVHVVDEESPARVEFLDQCESPFSAAYRVQEAMSTQVGNAMLEQLAKIKQGPATRVPMKFVISTGDNIDNNQLNEERWFVDLLDGETVNPNSGAETYDGYTQEQFAPALETRVLELAQVPFDSVGAGVPWYAVLGNHDGLVQGNAPRNDAFNAIAVGGTKPFRSLSLNEDCPDNPDDGQQMFDALLAALGTDGRSVPADPDRQFMSHEQIIEEYFNTTGVPDGHGLANAPEEDPVHGGRAGYYSFRISKRIRGISLDTIGYNGGPDGNIDDPQWNWLVNELKKYSKKYTGDDGKPVKNAEGKNKLIVVFSHHSSLTLNNPGGNPAGEPYHCYEPNDNPECAAGEGLHDLLLRFPNLIAWVNGHEHNNRVRRIAAPEDADPALGLWEVNTAAHIDWPQQSRLIEIAWKPGRTRKEADTIFIYGTDVDHGSLPEPDEGTQSSTDFLASVSRVESYYDACTRVGQADCAADGRPKKDRNVKLVQKAPFNLGR